MTLSLIATRPSTNDKNGNGKYRPLRNRKRNVSRRCGSFRALRNNDITMKFDTSRDPIYTAFAYLDQRSLPELMGDFVKDSFDGIANFISKVAK